MKLKSEKIIYPIQSSFKVVKYAVPQFDMPFHYHSEFELVYITKGAGKRYIGKAIHTFNSGDMVFMGPDLAHVWINEKSRGEAEDEQVEAIVLQFPEKLFASFWQAPEFARVRTLLERAQAGFRIRGKTRLTVAECLEEMLKIEGVDRLLLLLRILRTLSASDEVVLLNPLDLKPGGYHSDQRINVVYHYVMSRYQQKITVDEAASLAHMEKSAFCRLFKSKTQKTFTQFVNETRVDRACSLLLEGTQSISQIAFDVGFNNLANFYRQFQKITGETPGEYKAGSSL